MPAGSDLRPWLNGSRFPQTAGPRCVASLSLAKDGYREASLFWSATAHERPSPLSDPPGLDTTGQSRVLALSFYQSAFPLNVPPCGFLAFFRRPSSGSSHSLDTFAGIFL